MNNNLHVLFKVVVLDTKYSISETFFPSFPDNILTSTGSGTDTLSWSTTYSNCANPIVTSVLLKKRRDCTMSSSEMNTSVAHAVGNYGNGICTLVLEGCGILINCCNFAIAYMLW